MNTAARFLSQSTISRTWIVSILLAKAQWSTFILIIAACISALSIVYVTNSTRCLNASLQQIVVEREQLHVKWSQLLLEKSTLITQSRVQQVASEKMDMIVPNNKSIVIINE